MHIFYFCVLGIYGISWTSVKCKNSSLACTLHNLPINLKSNVMLSSPPGKTELYSCWIWYQKLTNFMGPLYFIKCLLVKILFSIYSTFFHLTLVIPQDNVCHVTVGVTFFSCFCFVVFGLFFWLVGLLVELFLCLVEVFVGFWIFF